MLPEKEENAEFKRSASQNKSGLEGQEDPLDDLLWSAEERRGVDSQHALLGGYYTGRLF